MRQKSTYTSVYNKFKIFFPTKTIDVEDTSLSFSKYEYYNFKSLAVNYLQMLVLMIFSGTSKDRISMKLINRSLQDQLKN